MAKSISPTSRTLEYIRSQGWVADTVERFNPYAGKFGKRHDYLCFADIIALGENSIIAIQSTGSAFSSHHKKLLEDECAGPNVEIWLKNGGRLLLIGWRKVKLKRGGKAMRWKPRIREYYLNDDAELKWKDK